MLPSTNPFVTAPAPFCLWNPSTAPLAAVLLLLNKSAPPSNAMEEELKVVLPANTTPALKVVTALTSRLLLALVPRTALPKALKALALLTVTGAAKEEEARTVSAWLLFDPRVTLALAVMGAVEAKVVAAFTINVLLPPLVPKTTLPSALKALPAATVTAALAVTGAANVVVAWTVIVWLLVAPNSTLPLAVRDDVAVMGAEKVETAATDRLLAPFVPNTTLPSADSAFPFAMVIAALAVIGAVEAKVVTAFTVSV